MATAVIAILLTTSSLVAADSRAKAFTSAWQGREVTLKRPLFSVVFDERVRYLSFIKRDGRVAGLTVGSPGDTYYLFEARRDSEEDIVDHDPERVVMRLEKQYRRSEHLNIGTVKDVDAAMLVRYEPGTRLVVKKVEIDRSRVRLFLHKGLNSELVSSLIVQWPAPLSKELSEAPQIEAVLARFFQQTADR